MKTIRIGSGAGDPGAPQEPTPGGKEKGPHDDIS